MGERRPHPGGLLNLGFTGLMTNGTTNYETLYDPDEDDRRRRGRRLTVDAGASDGDAVATINTQQYGFQFGVNARPPPQRRRSPPTRGSWRRSPG